MLRAEAEIVNKLGLHARAAAKLTQLAGDFAAEVWLSRNGRRVNAKSIMGVMMLAAGKGSRVVIEAEGEDAESALAAVVRLIAERFGEEEEAFGENGRESSGEKRELHPARRGRFRGNCDRPRAPRLDRAPGSRPLRDRSAGDRGGDRALRQCDRAGAGRACRAADERVRRRPGGDEGDPQPARDAAQRLQSLRCPARAYRRPALQRGMGA